MTTLLSPVNEGTLAAGSVLSTVMDTYAKAQAVGSHLKPVVLLALHPLPVLSLL